MVVQRRPSKDAVLFGVLDPIADTPVFEDVPLHHHRRYLGNVNRADDKQRISCFAARAAPPVPIPSASEPVSPMKTFRRVALNHRNPAQPPARAP
jgi:hypothetical protein